WPEQVHDETAWTIRPHCPIQPAGKKDHRHSEGHVQIRVGSSQQWAKLARAVSITHIPPDGSHAGNQAKPIACQDEDENGGEEPEGASDEIVTDDVFEKFMQTLHEPLPKVLRAFWNFLSPSHRVLSKNDQRSRHNPRNHH